MARGRMLNKTVCASLKFQELPDDTCRLLATWIISQLDVRGVFYGDPAMVKSYVFPRRADITIDDVRGYLDEMQATGLIVLFEAKGDIWQFWPGFTDNQAGLRADRETTEFPEPPDPESAPSEPGPAGAHPAASAEPEHAGHSPDTCRNDAGEPPDDSPQKRIEHEVKGIEENQTKRSPAAPDAQPDSCLPTTFEGWQKRVRGSQNSPATIREMITTLYPDHDPPAYAYIAKVAKRLGGAGRLAELLWQNSTRPPTGDILAYCQAVATKQKTRGSPDLDADGREYLTGAYGEFIQH